MTSSGRITPPNGLLAIGRNGPPGPARRSCSRTIQRQNPAITRFLSNCGGIVLLNARRVIERLKGDPALQNLQYLATTISDGAKDQELLKDPRSLISLKQLKREVRNARWFNEIKQIADALDPTKEIEPIFLNGALKLASRQDREMITRNIAIFGGATSRKFDLRSYTIEPGDPYRAGARIGPAVPATEMGSAGTDVPLPVKRLDKELTRSMPALNELQKAREKVQNSISQKRFRNLSIAGSISGAALHVCIVMILAVLELYPALAITGIAAALTFGVVGWLNSSNKEIYNDLIKKRQEKARLLEKEGKEIRQLLDQFSSEHIHQALIGKKSREREIIIKLLGQEREAEVRGLLAGSAQKMLLPKNG